MKINVESSNKPVGLMYVTKKNSDKIATILFPMYGQYFTEQSQLCKLQAL